MMLFPACITWPLMIRLFRNGIPFRPGKNEARFPVILKRDPSLKIKEVTLRIRIGNNENFKSGYPDLQEKVVTIADILTQPKYWDFYATYYFAGKYGKVKHQFMIDVTADMGLKNE